MRYLARCFDRLSGPSWLDSPAHDHISQNHWRGMIVSADMDDQATVLREVFGESSSESEDNERQGIGDYGDVESPSTFCYRNPRWERIEGVNGLWLCRDFLSPHQQSTLISAIQAEGWFTEAPHNQAMRFGDLPAWATEVSSSIREVVLFGDHLSLSQPMGLSSNFDGVNEANIFASNLLWREPLFDQLIVNVYQAGEGICAHIDLMRFEDGIAIVSLESSCVMHFSQAGEACDGQAMEKEKRSEKVPVLLTPGSLVLMSGEARYLWKHEINRKPGFQIWEGQELIRKRRTSITLRKLCRAE